LSKKADLEAFIGFRLSPGTLAQIHQIIEEYCDREVEKVVRKIVAEKLKKAVTECLKEKEELIREPLIKLKRIPESKAIAQIKKYIDEHQGCRTSDIIYDLELDPDLVLSVLRKLKEKGRIRSEDI